MLHYFLKNDCFVKISIHLPALIKNVRERILVEFDKGSFDDWCVFITRPGKIRYAPTDIEYFTILKSFGHNYSNKKIYDDFIKFYSITNKEIDKKVTGLITLIADSYKTDAEEIDLWFTVIYGGMVAEENKEFAVLKKRIKRLGMHQILIENKDAEFAANFSKGKKWKELDEVMKKRGF
jgi:hypothetical protein